MKNEKWKQAQFCTGRANEQVYCQKRLVMCCKCQNVFVYKSRTMVKVFWGQNVVLWKDWCKIRLLIFVKRNKNLLPLWKLQWIEFACFVRVVFGVTQSKSLHTNMRTIAASLKSNFEADELFPPCPSSSNGPWNDPKLLSTLAAGLKTCHNFSNCGQEFTSWMWRVCPNPSLITQHYKHSILHISLGP